MEVTLFFMDRKHDFEHDFVVNDELSAVPKVGDEINLNGLMDRDAQGHHAVVESVMWHLNEYDENGDLLKSAWVHVACEIIWSDE